MTKLERIIRESFPVRFLEDKSKKIILPGFRGVPLFDVIKFFISQLRKSSLTERASAISYNFIMAIPPTCLFLFTLLPNLPFVKKKIIKVQLHNLITDIIPAKDYNKNLIKFVDGFLDDARIGLLSFGFILLIYFASNGMMGIMRTFDKNYLGFQKRTELQKRWTAIKLTLINIGLLFSCIILLITQGAMLKWLGIQNLVLLKIILLIKWALIISLVFYSIAFIYKYAPSVHKKWKIASPGSLLATTLSLLATIGFSLFVNNFGKYNALYGSIGTVIVIMIIIYINSLVLLIGYELNVSIHSLQIMAEERKKQEAEKSMA